MTLNLPGKPYLALSGIIRYPVESVIRYYRIIPVEFDIRVYPESRKKVYPVHPGFYRITDPDSGFGTGFRILDLAFD